MRRWEPEGQPVGTAVLLHGVTSTGASWWRIGPALAARGWACLAPDLPGHGGARAEGQLDLDALAGGAVAQIPPAVDLLVGHSLGASVALAIAARHPGVARALVLEEPAGLGSVDLPVLADVIAADAGLVARDRDALVRREREENPRWAEEDVAHSVDGVALTDVEAVVSALRGPLRWDVPAMVAAATVPVLVLAAPDAPGLYPLMPGSALRGEERERVRAALPAEGWIELDGGHCLHRDLPDAWLEAVSAWAGRSITGRRGASSAAG